MTKARTVLIIFQIFYELYNNAIHRRFAFYSVYSTAQSEGQFIVHPSESVAQSASESEERGHLYRYRGDPRSLSENRFFVK